MHEWQSGVVFDWKIAVRHADKDATRDTAQFADKQELIFPTAYMFEHRIDTSNAASSKGSRWFGGILTQRIFG